MTQVYQMIFYTMTQDLGRFDLGSFYLGVYMTMFLLSIYADRQWQGEMLYGNTVKIFISDGDATIIVRRKEEVMRLD